jgi:plastocyanin
MLRTLVRCLPMVLVATATTAVAAEPKPVSHQVLIEGVRYAPQQVSAKVGDVIVWINHDPFPHTVTAAGKQFDSHDIAAGGSWKYTATHTGVFEYACTYHPTMKGTLRVN